MKTFALIENGVVVNVIDVGPEGWDSGIDVTDMNPRPGIGWQYDADAGFTAPASPEPEPAPEPVQNNIITNLAFDLRFTVNERVAIDRASIDDPSAPEDARIQAATLRVAQERSKKARFTDLDDPITRQGVQYMEQVGLIDEGRAAEILDAPVDDSERP